MTTGKLEEETELEDADEPVVGMGLWWLIAEKLKLDPVDEALAYN